MVEGAGFDGAGTVDRIERAEVIVCSPGRNFVTLKITTSDGIIGWGDATLNGRELAVAAYLSEHVVPCLLGRDATRIGDLWQYLYRGAYWRRGPVTMTAIAAVDVALWDILGKRAGLPVYELLGGKARENVLVYGHAAGADVAEMLDDVGRFLDAGFEAVRAQTGLAGVPQAYGAHAAGSTYDPADGSLPTETGWDTPTYLDQAPQYLAAVRDRFGFDFALLHDCHHRMTPNEAGRFGRSVEELKLFWMEDPTPAENQEGFRLIRQRTSTPIAVGEVLNSIWDVQTLITEQLIDYVRTSVSHAGGITHLRRIFDLAALYHVRSGSHGATDLSPVSLAAALALDITIPNFGIQEYMAHLPVTHEVFRPGYRLESGRVWLSDAPGLGVEVDEAAAKKFPYERKYLPVARLADGTLWDW
ncbi:MAG: D-galactonate dehydratase family protein [Propionibacteriaceae bacterium]|nr:D-galactonate dehydratase family protein [Propionibacteriaceae bacterium]